MGNRDEAMPVLRNAIKLAPANARARNALGTALLEKHRTDEAIALFQEGVRLNEKDAFLQHGLGLAFRQAGKTVEAAAAWQEAVRHNPNFAIARNDLAWLLATGPDGVRDGKRAVEHATRACELTASKTPSYIDTLAAAYAETGEFDKAVKYHEQALADPSFKKAHGKRVQERLDLYKRKKSYRDPTTTLPKD
jgi:Flp pilus assembly protein TadD